MKALISRDGANNETLTVKGKRWTIQDGMYFVLNMLTDKERLYAGSKLRGEYRGFAALHDFCDANMLLPEGNVDNVEECLTYWNRVMDLVTGYLCCYYSLYAEASSFEEVSLDQVKNA